MQARWQTEMEKFPAASRCMCNPMMHACAGWRLPLNGQSLATQSFATASTSKTTIKEILAVRTCARSGKSRAAVSISDRPLAPVMALAVHDDLPEMVHVLISGINETLVMFVYLLVHLLALSALFEEQLMDSSSPMSSMMTSQ